MPCCLSFLTYCNIFFNYCFHTVNNYHEKGLPRTHITQAGQELRIILAILSFQWQNSTALSESEVSALTESLERGQLNLSSTSLQRCSAPWTSQHACLITTPALPVSEPPRRWTPRGRGQADDAGGCTEQRLGQRPWY